MKLLQIVFILFLLFQTKVAHSQAEINKIRVLDTKNRFGYQNEIYKKDELGFVFERYEPLHNEYNRSLKQLKGANRLGKITLGLIGGGFVAIAAEGKNTMYCDLWCLTTLDQIGIISIFLISPLTGTMAIIKHLKGNSKLNTVIKVFNNMQGDEYGRKVEQPIISLSSQGVGIQIRF